MKNLVSTIILVALCTITNAQISTELSDRIDYNEKNGNIRLSTSKDKAVSAKFLATDKARLQLAPETDLQLARQTTDKDGLTHYGYTQYHEGIRVEGGNLIIHEKGGKAMYANGRLSKGLTTKKQLVFSEEQALEKAIGSFDAARFVWEMSESELPPQMSAKERSYPQAEIVWLPAEIWTIEQSCMAYKFDIFSIEPLKREWVYVNVETGNIELTINQIHAHNCFETTTCSHTKNNNIPTSSNQSEEETFATSNYAGEVEIGTDFDGEVYSLKTYINNVKIQTYNSNHQRGFPLDALTSSDNTWSDPTAIDVHWGMTQSYNYYYDVHERYSYDNEGSDIMSWVHYGDDFANAFWTGSWMGFGDGGENYSPLTSLDIVAHEFTHAITQHSTKLVYAGESGALNESFSDIFGELVEHYYHPDGNDWIIGSDVVEVSGKNGIRNLANPKDPQMIRQQPDTYLGEYWHEGISDFGGVHINSGVQNYWFYLLMEGGVGINDNNFAYDVEGVGIAVATEIAYRMLNQLSPTATYEEARTVSIWIAEQVFSGNPEIAERTAAAWCAVGVGNDCTSDISCAVRDSLVLIDLYDGWNINQPMETWLGVELDENRCVSKVMLNDVIESTNELPVALSLLSELDILHLKGCGFTGHIPAEFGQLSQLEELNLAGNELTGTLPPELAYLDSLELLFCGGNNLSGTLPPQYGQLTNLVYISLGDNNLSGTLPSAWSNMISLNYMTLASNNLSGTLPVEWSTISNLIILEVQNNLLSGEIPQEYTQLNWLALLLHNNQFSGTVPNFSGGELSVQNNRFTFAGLEDNMDDISSYAPQAAIPLLRTDNELSVDAGGDLADNTYEWYKDGSLFTTITGDNTLTADTYGTYKCMVSNAVLTNPDAFNGTKNLILESTELYIDPRPCAMRDSLILHDFYYATGESDSLQWDFTQPMSTWNGVITNTEGCVRHLVLNDKGLSGTLPENLYDLSELERLFLYKNPGLSGNIIPPAIGNLTKLEMYSIAGCGFTDTIPDELGQLTDLWHFSIGKNDFSGTFPTTLLQLTELEYLQIAQNNFIGYLPEGLGNLTKLEFLGLYANEFEGTVPAALASLTSLSELYLYANNFTSPLPVFSNQMDTLNIRKNGFNFDDVMKNIHLLDNNFIYEDQDKLPIYSNGNALYVNAGGNVADNTYVWYKDTDPIPVDTIVGNQEYIPAVAGQYYCKVTNAILSNNILKDQNLILESETYGSSSEASGPVYPGDMDNNGIVNNYDALYWGLSNGYRGYARPDATTDWEAQPSSNWVATLEGINAKHQDADGNSIIDEADFDVISLNYGQTYLTPTANEDGYSPTNIEAELISSERTSDTTTTLEIQISLNNVTNNPVVMHGIAFDLDYESELPFVLMDATLDFSNSWLTAGDNNSLKTVSHINNDVGRISFGITRGDHQNIIGIGEVMTAFIVICQDIPTGDPTESHITINSGSSISANQILTPLTGNTFGIINNPPPPPATCIENDDNTLLLLPFDGHPNGLSGEVPVQADVTYDTGVFEQAAYISGYDSGLTFNTPDNFNTAEGTLEVWVKPDWNGNDGRSHVILQAGTYGGMLMEKDGGSYLKIILNRWASQGQPEVGIGYNVAHWQAGEWQHIAYTWGNGELLIYINGTIVASKNYTNVPPLNISEFNIGKDYWGGHTWNGLMDELRISDVIRTPQEIMDAVEACAPPSDAPITCIDNDDSSLLVLPFENNPNGLSGETPTQADLTYNAGTFGQAANISTGSNGLTFSTTDNLNTSEGSLEVWVKPLWDGDDGQSHVILQAGTSGGMLMEKDGGNYLKIILNRWGGTSEISLGYNVAHWEAGQWRHIAYTWGNQQVCMYVNGEPVDCKTNVNIPALNVGEFNIGRDYNGGNTWDGLMDELRISNIARNPQQIEDAVAGCSIELRYQQRLEVDIRNYPNPFAEYTTIEFELLEDNPTIIQIFDIKGSPVATVLNEHKTKGKHHLVFDAKNLSTGMYYYMIRSGEYFGRKNMMVIR